MNDDWEKKIAVRSADTRDRDGHGEHKASSRPDRPHKETHLDPPISLVHLVQKGNASPSTVNNQSVDIATGSGGCPTDFCVTIERGFVIYPVVSETRIFRP